MKRETESLLDAVLAESLTPDFREVSLAATLCVVRRRRRAQQWQRGALIALLVVGLPLAAWRLRPIPMPAASPAQSRAPSVTTVESRPLTPNEIVTTQPGSTPVVDSSPTNVTVVETDPARAAIPDLTDDQLLDLVAGHAAALVRIDGRVRLVIADARRVQ